MDVPKCPGAQAGLVFGLSTFAQAYWFARRMALSSGPRHELHLNNGADLVLVFLVTSGLRQHACVRDKLVLLLLMTGVAVSGVGGAVRSR